jgi:dissimilatory sulfite reductase (desulfoviridin) alpha/beta subunit
MDALEKYNNQKRKNEEFRPNGTPCPNCGAELNDFGFVALMEPMFIKMKCLKCGYEGTRFLKDNK